MDFGFRLIRLKMKRAKMVISFYWQLEDGSTLVQDNQERIAMLLLEAEA